MKKSEKVILDLMLVNKYVSINDILGKVDYSRSTIYKTLKKFCDKDIYERYGDGGYKLNHVLCDDLLNGIIRKTLKLSLHKGDLKIKKSEKVILDLMLVNKYASIDYILGKVNYSRDTIYKILKKFCDKGICKKGYGDYGYKLNHVLCDDWLNEIIGKAIKLS